VRESDLIIRHGDALFVCGIAGVSAAAVADRLAVLREELADPPHLARVTIGVAERLADETAEQLIERATSAAR
jgi:GGDEF domain-containing protein